MKKVEKLPAQRNTLTTPGVVWEVSTELTRLLFESHDDAQRYAASFTATHGFAINPVPVWKIV